MGCHVHERKGRQVDWRLKSYSLRNEAVYPPIRSYYFNYLIFCKWHFPFRAWTSYGADIKISTHDITTESGCEQMLKMALDMGPVDAIFNLAVILKDSIFQNQTAETFKISYGPKALATMHLDKLSRKMCPSLKYVKYCLKIFCFLKAICFILQIIKKCSF